MINTAAFALPKPGHLAGRVVLSSSGYSRRKRELWRDQGHACAWCERPLNSPKDGSLHHPGRRGMNGSKRDDREGVLICGNCHAQEHS